MDHLLMSKEQTPIISLVQQYEWKQKARAQGRIGEWAGSALAPVLFSSWTSCEATLSVVSGASPLHIDWFSLGNGSSGASVPCSWVVLGTFALILGDLAFFLPLSSFSVVYF